jgi:magnesium and cobalt transporter
LKTSGFISRFLKGMLPPAGDEDPGSDEVTTERREMIEGIEELSETMVKEVMVPRIDTVFLGIDAPRDELLQTVTSCGHSRIPVYRETIDDVAGVLYVKDLLLAILKGGEIDLAALIRKPFFVPESKRIDALLREFKRRHVHIAIAIDEYGGVSGIVCMEDIIEEIVGDIQDEFDDEREGIVELGESMWLCDARVNLEDLNDATDLGLPEDDFDTLGGFVFDLFGKIPARYEKIGWKTLDFIIQEMDGHKIGAVKILKRPEAPEES